MPWPFDFSTVLGLFRQGRNGCFRFNSRFSERIGGANPPGKQTSGTSWLCHLRLRALLKPRLSTKIERACRRPKKKEEAKGARRHLVIVCWIPANGPAYSTPPGFSDTRPWHVLGEKTTPSVICMRDIPRFKYAGVPGATTATAIRTGALFRRSGRLDFHLPASALRPVACEQPRVPYAFMLTSLPIIRHLPFAAFLRIIFGDRARFTPSSERIRLKVCFGKNRSRETATLPTLKKSRLCHL